MTASHALIPFDHAPLSFQVTARAERQGSILSLTFSLTDTNHDVIWPEQHEPMQQDYLWESTCFEAFIKAANRTDYFELNLAPSLAWNLYHFDHYRSPKQMPPRRLPAAKLSAFSIEGHSLRVSLDLGLLNLTHQEIHLGLTAVIKTPSARHYLAIHHPAAQADFHDARGWTITLLPDARFPESVVDNKA